MTKTQISRAMWSKAASYFYGFFKNTHPMILCPLAAQQTSNSWSCMELHEPYGAFRIPISVILTCWLYAFPHTIPHDSPEINKSSRSRNPTSTDWFMTLTTKTDFLFQSTQKTCCTALILWLSWMLKVKNSSIFFLLSTESTAQNCCSILYIVLGLGTVDNIYLQNFHKHFSSDTHLAKVWQPYTMFNRKCFPHTDHLLFNRHNTTKQTLHIPALIRRHALPVSLYFPTVRSTISGMRCISNKCHLSKKKKKVKFWSSVNAPNMHWVIHFLFYYTCVLPLLA